jgi:hypothetical protein
MANFLFALTFFATFIPVLALGRTLASADVQQIKSDIQSAFNLFNGYGLLCNPHNGKTITPCDIGDNLALLVRLAFHDAVGWDGPNGCLDFTNSDNNGLQGVVATLDSLYLAKNYASIISKADLWSLAAHTAIAYASTKNTTGLAFNPPPGPGPQLDATPGTLNIPWQYGRQDYSTCNDTGAFPAKNSTWSQTKALLGTRVDKLAAPWAKLLRYWGLTRLVVLDL